MKYGKIKMRGDIMTEIYAHRGSSGTHAENTMAAFIEAEQAGADGIEFDLHLSKDDELVVIHDPTVNRTTNGKGKVKDKTLNELKQLKAGKKFLFFRKKDRIPTFDEVLQWARLNEMKLNIEIKYDQGEDNQIEEKVIKKVLDMDLQDRVIISSFNHQKMFSCKRNYPDMTFGILFKNKKFARPSYLKEKPIDAIHPNYQIVTLNMYNKVKQLGLSVRPYTVNSKKQIKRLLKMNCDAIITDYPKRAVELRNKHNKTHLS